MGAKSTRPKIAKPWLLQNIPTPSQNAKSVEDYIR